MIHRDIDRVLFTSEQIAARVRELAARLAADLAGQLEREGAADPEGRIVLIPVMTGAIVFVADLIRRMPMKLSLELVAVSSYPGRATESRGAVMASELPETLAGRHAVIIDDILDSGRTLKMVRDLVAARGAASVRTVVLLDKRARRQVDIEPDYCGFAVPDAFVVGYGLDYNGYYRNLPEIATLRPEVTS